MPARRYTTETIEADPEQFTEFTEADIESLEFVPEELEELEAESTESINLEDVNPESVAEALESLMEGEEAYGYLIEGEEAYGYEANGTTPPSPSRTGTTPPSLSRTANWQSLKTFTNIVKKLVQKIMSNPKARAKLQAAARKGPTAVVELLAPSVAKVLPQYLHWMIPIYLPPVTLALFDPIRKQVGVKPEEVEEAPEFLGSIAKWLAKKAVRVVVKAITKKVKSYSSGSSGASGMGGYRQGGASS